MICAYWIDIARLTTINERINFMELYWLFYLLWGLWEFLWLDAGGSHQLPIGGLPKLLSRLSDEKTVGLWLFKVCGCCHSFAVSSSPRPWMDVSALPEKSNMAVTESDPDPKVQKMSICGWNFSATGASHAFISCCYLVDLISDQWTVRSMDCRTSWMLDQ